jgi:peptidoglycan L-alanyl-D-glutamate endopeptidase CwlK
MNILGKASKANLDGVHPDLVKVIEKAIKDSLIDFSITSGVRTTVEQKSLYAQGRTKPGAIVTNADGVKNKSNHQAKNDGYGYAIDFCPYINGKLDWNTESNFKIVAQHILDVAKCMGIKIEWGGIWRFKDLPHIQLKS